MKAIGAYSGLPSDNEASLQDVEIPTPQAAGSDLLVRVKAVSVNPVDTKLRRNIDGSLSEPKVFGWDCAGIVEAKGEGCTLFNVGDEVFYAGDVTRPGCNSELHLVDERIVGPKPGSLSFAEAASLPLTAITAWESLFDRMGVSEERAQNEGKSILIIAGAGGVGSIAIQLARQVAGLKVIATASRPETAQWCLELGADHVINHRKSLSEELAQEGLDGVDYILCAAEPVQHWDAMAQIIRPQGKLCLIVDTADNQPVNINPFKAKSASICWEFMFTRPRFGTADMAKQGELLKTVSCLCDETLLRHTQTEHFGPMSAENLRLAHARVESGSMIGKLVLSQD